MLNNTYVHPFTMLYHHAEKNPERILIYSEEEDLTYKEAVSLILRTSSYLSSLGIEKGDLVGLALPKKASSIIMYLSLMYLNAIPFPIHIHEPRDSLKRIIRKTNPRLVFSCIEQDLPNLIRWDEKHWKDLLPKEASSIEDKCNTPPDEIAYLNFTSGSTGEPKAAITTYKNIFYNTLASIEALGLNEDDIHLCLFPIWVHPHEIWARPLYLGGSIVLTDTVFPKTMSQLIQEKRVTTMMAVAPIYQTLISLKSQYDLSSLRVAESGGMYFPPYLIKEFRTKTSIQVIPVWGSTETTGIAFYNPDPEEDITSLGKICPYYECKLEETCEEGAELLIKGEGVVKGYYNDDELTNRQFEDKWYHTGDIVIERQDRLIFAGRMERLIKVAGLKAYPDEIEQALLTHPSVREAAVISIPDRVKGEIPKAFISLRTGMETSLELKQYLKGILLDHKIPKDIEVLDALPMSSSGKVSYLQLNEIEMEHTKRLKLLEERIKDIDKGLLELIKKRHSLILDLLSLRRSLELNAYSFKLKSELGDEGEGFASGINLSRELAREILDILFDRSLLGGM